MIQMTFSFQEIEALAQGRFTHPHPFVRCKMEAVLLKAAHLPHQTICQLCGICGNTLRSYLAEYQTGGLAQLTALRFYRPVSALEVHRAYSSRDPRIGKAVSGCQSMCDGKLSTYSSALDFRATGGSSAPLPEKPVNA